MTELPTDCCRGGTADLEFSTYRSACRIETLTIDAIEIAILEAGFPDDNESAIVQPQ
ncbi:MAG: hypothetical protein R3C49_06745 [Planctomycetaceae bacterium]